MGKIASHTFSGHIIKIIFFWMSLKKRYDYFYVHKFVVHEFVDFKINISSRYFISS